MTRTILPSRISSLGRLNRVLSGKTFDNSRFFLIVDENTYSHCLPILISHVDRLHQAEFIEVPAGEECKDPAIASQLWQTLLDSNADRDTVLVNLGGGCITDLGGFVAASYKRGIRHINIPTTLIGMVDAAIGGKTALNINGSKNQVGFFHQPAIVCIETSFLHTLPDAEIINGLFEMLKTFLIGNRSHFQSLCQTILSGSLDLQPGMIAACAEIKTAIVKQDPRDLGIRPQPKKQNKRLTSAFFLNLYRKICVDGARIHLKTDSRLLHFYTRALLDANGIIPDFVTDDLYASDYKGVAADIQTFYEKMFLAEGKKITYLNFKLAKDRQIVEIPKFVGNL